MKITKDTEYVNSLKAVDANGEEVTRFVAQPYLTAGMYIAMEPGTFQLTQTHKGYPNWVKKSIEKMEKQGHTVTTTTSTYGAWFTDEEINTYIN